MLKFSLRTYRSTGHFPEAHILTRKKAQATPITTDRPRSTKKWHFAPRKFKFRLFCCDYDFGCSISACF